MGPTDHGWRICIYGNRPTDFHCWNIKASGFGQRPESLNAIPLKDCELHHPELCAICSKPMKEGLHNHPTVVELSDSDRERHPEPQAAPPLEIEHPVHYEEVQPEPVASAEPEPELAVEAPAPEPVAEPTTEEPVQNIERAGYISIEALADQVHRHPSSVRSVMHAMNIAQVKKFSPKRKRRLYMIANEDARKIREHLKNAPRYNRPHANGANGANGASAPQTPVPEAEAETPSPPGEGRMAATAITGSRMDQVKTVISWVQGMGFTEFHVVGGKATWKQITVKEGEVSL